MLDRRRSRGTEEGTPCSKTNDADLTVVGVYEVSYDRGKRLRGDTATNRGAERSRRLRRRDSQQSRFAGTVAPRTKRTDDGDDERNGRVKVHLPPVVRQPNEQAGGDDPDVAELERRRSESVRTRPTPGAPRSTHSIAEDVQKDTPHVHAAVLAAVPVTAVPTVGVPVLIRAYARLDIMLVPSAGRTSSTRRGSLRHRSVARIVRALDNVGAQLARVDAQLVFGAKVFAVRVAAV